MKIVFHCIELLFQASAHEYEVKEREPIFTYGRLDSGRLGLKRNQGLGRSADSLAALHRLTVCTLCRYALPDSVFIFQLSCSPGALCSTLP